MWIGRARKLKGVKNRRSRAESRSRSTSVRGRVPRAPEARTQFDVEEVLLKHSLGSQFPGIVAGESRSHFRYFCSCCKNPRLVSQSPNPYSLSRLGRLALTHAFLMVVCWPLLGWKGLVLALPILAIFEGVYRMRFRAQVRCNFCGFDPHLYQRDVPALRREMESYWRSKYASAGVPFPGDAEASGDVDAFAYDAENADPQDDSGRHAFRGEAREESLREAAPADS